MKRYNIVLDLDNTLILTLPLQNSDRRHSRVHIHFVEYTIGTIRFRTYARPYLTYFLQELNKIANISVWTAATRGYAEFMIKHFFPPEITIHLLLTREETVRYSKRTGRLKPVDVIFPRDTTYIVDDLEYVHQSNPWNSIPIVPFTRESLQQRDTDLIRVLNVISSL